jgi:hypothetical protein
MTSTTRVKKHHQRLRAAGLCLRCARRKAKAPSPYCLRCRTQRDAARDLDKERASQARLRADRRASGVCIECADALATSHASLCATHLAGRRAAQQRYEQKRRRK